MTSANVIHDLTKKLNISEIGVYKRIEKIKKDLKITNTEVAKYCLAFENDINLNRYDIDEKILDKVENALRSKHLVSSTLPTHQKKSLRKNPKNTIVQFGNTFSMDHPLFSKTLKKEAVKMSEIYPLFYVFENSIRKLIETVESNKHGKSWWNKATIPFRVKQKVTIRMADENKNKWHGKRGAHEICYTDIEELVSIIESNWSDFESLLPNQHWVRTMIEIIGTSRNVVAHNNPLSPDDISALKVHFKQWMNQIKDINTN